MTGLDVAGVITDDEAAVAFADLPLYEASAAALERAETLVAAMQELRERLISRRLDSADRWDLGEDLYAEASKLQAFALEVMFGVQP